MAAQLAVTIIYITFITRIVLFFYIKCSAIQAIIAPVVDNANNENNNNDDINVNISDHQQPSSNSMSDSSSPEQSKLFCFCRAFLDLLNGGFYCAGPLDTLRPATAMDLRFLPTIRYKPGLSFKHGGQSLDQDDLSCSICMSEYEDGEILRLLYCQRRAIHHYHKQCVDSWLLRNATCPLCRSSVSQERGEQQLIERKERRERRRQRRERNGINNNFDDNHQNTNNRTRSRSNVEYHQIDSNETVELV